MPGKSDSSASASNSGVQAQSTAAVVANDGKMKKKHIPKPVSRFTPKPTSLYHKMCRDYLIKGVYAKSGFYYKFEKRFPKEPSGCAPSGTTSGENAEATSSSSSLFKIRTTPPIRKKVVKADEGETEKTTGTRKGQPTRPKRHGGGDGGSEETVPRVDKTTNCQQNSLQCSQKRKIKINGKGATTSFEEENEDNNKKKKSVPTPK